jgi:hypothetical protein
MRWSLVLIVAACSSTKHTAPTPDAFQSMGSGASCATLTSGIADFQPGIDDTPAGFPAAPSGLILCGTDPMTGSLGAAAQGWYLAGNLTQDAVFSYYQSALTTAGYTVSAPVAEPDSNTKLAFTKGSAATGSVVYNSASLFVLLTYPP